MATDGIFITAATLTSLPLPIQKALIGTVFGETGDGIGPQKSVETNDGMEVDVHFAEFSPSQAKAFLAGCGERTKKAIEVVADSPSRQFRLADIAAALDTPAGELRGVWSGLTRRTQTISGDPEAYLIDWVGEVELDADGTYIDQLGEVTELTYRSFRKALNRS